MPCPILTRRTQMVIAIAQENFWTPQRSSLTRKTSVSLSLSMFHPELQLTSWAQCSGGGGEAMWRRRWKAWKSWCVNTEYNKSRCVHLAHEKVLKRCLGMKVTLQPYWLSKMDFLLWQVLLWAVTECEVTHGFVYLLAIIYIKLWLFCA